MVLRGKDLVLESFRNYEKKNLYLKVQHFKNAAAQEKIKKTAWINKVQSKYN